MGWKPLALLLFLTLAGCQSSGGSFCDVSEPVRLSEQAIVAMSDAEVDAALAHNRLGSKLCGWAP